MFPKKNHKTSKNYEFSEQPDANIQHLISHTINQLSHIHSIYNSIIQLFPNSTLTNTMLEYQQTYEEKMHIIVGYLAKFQKFVSQKPVDENYVLSGSFGEDMRKIEQEMEAGQEEKNRHLHKIEEENEKNQRKLAQVNAQLQHYLKQRSFLIKKVEALNARLITREAQIKTIQHEFIKFQQTSQKLQSANKFAQLDSRPQNPRLSPQKSHISAQKPHISAQNPRLSPQKPHISASKPQLPQKKFIELKTYYHNKSKKKQEKLEAKIGQKEQEICEYKRLTEKLQNLLSAQKVNYLSDQEGLKFEVNELKIENQKLRTQNIKEKGEFYDLLQRFDHVQTNYELTLQRQKYLQSRVRELQKNYL